MSEQTQRLLKIKNLTESEGGQELLSNAQKDIDGIIYQLTVIYPTASHLELISALAKLDSLMELKNQLITAEEKYQEALEEDKNLGK
jgi:hypothetical protein